MRSCFFLLIWIFLLIQTVPASGQYLVKNTSMTGVCYAGNKVKRIFIPPPDEFLKKGSKGGGSITVNYTGFSVQAKIAVEHAVSIIESLLPADTKTTLNAVWKKVTTSGVLGSSVVTGYAAGWGIDARNPMAYYPIALAEKITGEKLNDDLQGDIELTINSSKSWYFGTDGKTPSTKYDLVTVVMHEILHGMGIYSSMEADGTTGFYGISSMPVIYDTFIENSTGKQLTDTLKFLNHSPALRTQLIGNNLFFKGTVLSSKAKLYAPSLWDNGSSVAHLDENSFKDADALMTPFIDLGEAVHNPGNIVKAMLADLGWINTRIGHQPQKDTEEHLTRLTLSAEIISDTSYNRNSVGLVYSFDDFISRDTLFLISPAADDNFRISLDIPAYNSDVQYYFFVEDHFFRVYNSPSLIDVFRYETYIGTDTVKPVLTHIPIDYCFQTIDSLNFKTSATDNIGIDSVYIEYIKNDDSPGFIGLIAGTNGDYKASVVTRQMDLHGGDSIRYKIYAVDSANTANVSVLPEKGYFVFPVQAIGLPAESYSTDFSNAESDFFNLGFEIKKPAGFSKPGLHTKHPYESPEDNDASIQYTSMLRRPIILNETGLLITYNEIVLVEPGESGSVFGSNEFYDYVILEGSRNFGKTWFNLTDGYDSRYLIDWEIVYNAFISGNNSGAIGSEEMLQKHTIYYRPSDKISVNDTLLMRFRLFSDPFANGWGWVIQDLTLNPLIDAAEKINNYDLRVFPNPGNGIINLQPSRGPDITAPIRYSIYNFAGVCVADKLKTDVSGSQIDISAYPSGIYIIVLYLDDGIKRFKYSLIK